MLKLLIILQVYGGITPGAKVYEIPPIEVSAKYQENILSSKGTTYLVDSTLLNTFPYDPYFTNVFYIPSVTANIYGFPGYLQTVSSRGFSSTRTGIYFEGFKLNSRSSGSFNLSLLSGLPLSGIEMLSSSGSSVYGENTPAGVLNLKLKRKPGFNLKGGAGNLRTTLFSGEIGLPFTYIYYSNYTSIPLSPNKETHLSKYTSLIENENFKSILLYSKNNIGNPTSYVKKEKDELLLFGNRFNYKFFNIGYQYKKESIKIDTLIYTKDTAYGFLEKINVLQKESYKAWNVSNRIFGDFVLPLNVLKIRLGFEYEKEYLRGTLFEEQDTLNPEDERLYPYFSFDLLIPGFTPYFEGGKELKGIFKTESPFIYRTGFIFYSEYLSLFFNYSRGFKAPTLFDLYWPNTGLFKGNPDLKSEESKEMEGGIRVLSDGFYMSLSYFKRRLINGIVWAPTQNWMWTPQNIAEIKTQGLEGMINVKKEEYLLNMNFIFYKDRKQIENNIETTLFYVPTYQFTFLIGENLKNFSFYYRARFIGPHLSYDPETFRNVEIKHIVFNDLSFKFKLNPYLRILILITNFDNKPYEFIKGYPLERRRIYVFAEANI